MNRDSSSRLFDAAQSRDPELKELTQKDHFFHGIIVI